MSMKLKFKSQKYQEDAVNSVVNVFKGQEYVEKDLSNFDREGSLERIAFINPKLRISEKMLLENIKAIQNENNLKYPGSQQIQINNNVDKDDVTKALNLTIEMETGTGKTYVYIKTIHELYKKYGFKKFIVMVPSIAIREGVLKSFKITEEHFKEIYNQRINYWIFDNSNSSNLANISKFCETDGIHVIIMNYQAFNSRTNDTRRIFMELDQLNSSRPIDLINVTRPIVILDEPQRFGNATLEKLIEFNPNFILRYSATHRSNPNKIFKLDAVDAINRNLVKKINVLGVKVSGVEGNTPYLFLDSIVIRVGSSPFARIEIDVLDSRGNAVRKVVNINSGDNLYHLSNNNSAYRDGYTVTQIDGGGSHLNKVSFSGQPDISEGEVIGSNSVVESSVRTLQIRRTIREHLYKERELFKRGIKVLSLFFIDTVSKYRIYEDNIPVKGEYAEIFEKEYQSEVNKILENILDSEDSYKKYLESHASELHAGYFSIDSNGRMKDPKTETNSGAGSSKVGKDSSDYDLIMKDKERLLSFEEPVRFIFSHSALREGWDNPNVFQICTLKVAQQGDSKRQEIGRGLRICVDRNGIRMDEEQVGDEFKELNKLTVIASESYREFVEKLQEEYFADGYRIDDVATPGGNLQVGKNPIELNSNFKNKKFQNLWQAIKIKNSYTVEFDSEKLTSKCIEKINHDLRVDNILIHIDHGEVLGVFGEDAPLPEVGGMGGTHIISAEDSKTMNFTKYDLVKEITDRTNLTRVSIVRILKEISEDKFNLFKKNPIQFINEVSRIINYIKSKSMLDGIKYFSTSKDPFGEDIFSYYMPTNIEIPSNMFYSKKHIAEYLTYDSITELNFAKGAEHGEEVEVFAKLPRKFLIPTPAGNYSPDWAVTIKLGQEKDLYIVETKGYDDEDAIPEIEKLKIDYTRKAFESSNTKLKIEGVRYIVALTQDDPYINFINKIND